LAETLAKVTTSVATAATNVKSASAELNDAHRKALDDAISKFEAAASGSSRDINSGIGTLSETVHTSLAAQSQEVRAATATLTIKQGEILGELTQTLAQADSALASRHADLAREVDRLSLALISAQSNGPTVPTIIGAIVAALGIGGGLGVALYNLAPQLLLK
jgi:hypothetical protein